MSTNFNQRLRDAFSLSKAVNGTEGRRHKKDGRGSATVDDVECTFSRGEETDEDYRKAVEKFRKGIEVAGNNDPSERARGFDYVLWRPNKHRRLHKNTDGYVRVCQGLAPYISAVSTTAWQGMEARRWAGMNAPRPAELINLAAASKNSFQSITSMEILSDGSSQPRRFL